MKHLKLFFALFAMLALGVGNAWGAEYELVTSEPSDWSGEYLVVYNKGCFNGSLTTGFDKSAPVDVTISNNKINLDEKYAMIIGKQGTAYSLKTASGYYIGRESSSSNGMDASQTWGIKYTINFTWNATNKTVKIAGKGGKCLGLNSTTWRFYAASNTYVNLSLYKKVESGSTEPVLSATPTEIDFGTVDQGTTVQDKTVTVNFENLTGAVTYSGLSTPFTATGAISATGDKITISADASTIGERSQTLTIQSAADSKTAEVTVRINVEAPFNGKKLDFDFVNHPTGWPVKSNATAGEYVYNLDDTDYTFKHSKSGDGVYVAGTSGTSGYLLIASGNTLGLPAIKGHKLVKVQGTLNNSGSPSTSASVSITDGTNTLSGGTAQTWNTKGGIYTYSLSGTQANTMYYLSVSNKNLQMITLVLYYEECEKYALTITEPAVGTGTLLVKDGENTLTSGAEIYEGTKLTVTATPAAGYEEGVVVVVKNASDEDVTADVYDAGTLTMPAYAVTISATFDKKECTLLATPTVSATTTYNSATLSWGAVTKAAKYSVKIGDKEAVETTATSYEVTDLNAETTYTYQVQAIAEAGQDTDCDSKVAEGTFTTATAPTATLTLKDIVGETTQTGSLNGTITLPTEAAECSKTFVGWSAVEIPEPGEKPATHFYAPGAEYTLAAETQTLYAVYADVEGGEPTWNRVTNLAALTSGGTFILGYEATPKSGTIIPMRTSGTATISAAGYMYSGNADGTTSNNATLDMASISESSKFEIVLEASSIVDGAVNIKLGDNYLGNTNTKNNCKLFTSASKNTAFTPTIGTNDVVKLTIKANNDYTTLQFNNNSGSYRYAVYGGAQKDVVFYKKEITSSYSNYSTTCAAAPIATVVPTSVTATVAGGNGKVEVTYKNVNTANVAVALYNDDACTEAFTAGWLNASIDEDKNIVYTVAENTTYAQRKAYIQLTAPETTGATDPDVVVIPVTQAAKEKVFASLAELVAADLTAGDEVTVTLNNDVIKDFYIYSSKRYGVVFDVQKDGKDIKIYFNSQTTIDDWAVGGKLSGTLTNVKWTTYSSAWQLAPANTWAWANLTYTEPKAVSTVVVSGAPTKTTYVDGEAFDPAGLTVTVNYNDATTEVNPTGVTFAVTPATLVKGQTSVSVTATFNSVTSAAYEVTGLTVNDIPTKTVAEFIAAGGTRCYLEGIVSGLTEGNSMKYGNFDLTDASGTIYVYGCLNAAGESQKFAALGVKNGDKIKVIADEYELYGGTKDEAKNVQYVSHISAASITVENITMEVEEVAIITATVDQADAVVTYTIKENAANAISLSGNTITALKEGTATITATVAEGATYLGNSVDFTVTVGPKTESDEVVILAELDGKWYAMKGEKASGTGQIAALEVTYFNGTLYNVADDDKAAITWTRIVVDGKVAFVNNGKYLKGTSSDTDLALDGSKCEWTFNGTTYTIGNRTFLYRENFNFKNYNTEKADASDAQGNYSALPVVTAPVYATGLIIGEGENTLTDGETKDVVISRSFTADALYTISLPFALYASQVEAIFGTGTTLYQFSGLEQADGELVMQFSNVTAIAAATPYLIKPAQNVDPGTLVEGVTIEIDPVNIEFTAGATTVTMKPILSATEEKTNGRTQYWLATDNYLYNNETQLLSLRALFEMTTISGMPPRCRAEFSENEETALDYISTTDAPIKVIENGQLIIIRDDVKYNVQGVRL